MPPVARRRPELAVAVNVSARRLLYLAFPDEVGELLARHRCPRAAGGRAQPRAPIMADPVLALEILAGSTPWA